MQKPNIRALLTGASAAVLAAMLASPAQAGVYRDDVGDQGAQDYAAGWDGVVQLYLLDPSGSIFFNCSGSMINPRTVLSAAHCFNDLPAEFYGTGSGGFVPIIAYGDDTFPTLLNWASGGPQFADDMNGLTFGTDVIIHPDSDPGFGQAVDFPAADVAMVATLDPLYTVPTYGMLFSRIPDAEVQDGVHTVQVGYGSHGPASQSSATYTIDGKRRAGENMLGFIGSQNDYTKGLARNENAEFDDPSSDQVMYWTDMDLPGREGQCARGPALGFSDSISCTDSDFFSGVLLDNDTVVLPGPGIDYFPGDALPNEFTTAGGDSGGPLIADELYVNPLILGVLSGGFQPGFFHTAGQEYGSVSYYNPLFAYHQFISENNPYKYVSALEGDGNWSDPTHWVQTLDPNYFVYDEEGNIVNGLPGGDELGFRDTPSTGDVFDTDPNDVTEDGFAPPPPDGDPGRSLAELTADHRSDAQAGVHQDAEGRATDHSSHALALNGGEGEGGARASQDERVEPVAPVYSTQDTVIQEVSGLDQTLTGPGSTNFVPNNTDGQPGQAFRNPAQYFEVTLAADGTTTLDIDATIDKLTVNGAGAALDIDEGFSLTSIINAEVFAGNLNVDGGLTSREVVLWGGSLTGEGTLQLINLNMLFGNGVVTPGTLFNVNGVISPGDLDSVGQLDVIGDVVLTSGSTFLVNVNGAQSDLLSIAGNASLGGQLVLGYSTRPQFGDEYVVLTTTGETIGDFDSVNSPQLQGVLFAEAMVDEAGSVIVEIDAQDFVDFLGPDANDTSLSVGAALDQVRGSSYGVLSEVYGVVDYLPAGPLQQALPLLAPNHAIVASDMALSNSYLLRNAVDQRASWLRYAGGDADGVQVSAQMQGVQVASADPMAAFMAGSALMQDTEDRVGSTQIGTLPDGWGAYIDMTAAKGDTSALQGAEDGDLDAFTISGGVDRAFTPNVRGGASLFYQESEADMNEFGETGLDGFSGTLYGLYHADNGMFANLYGGIGLYDISYQREDPLFGDATRATGDTEASQHYLGFKTGIDVEDRFNLGGFNVLTPSAGLYYASYDFDDYVEDGGQAALAVDSFKAETMQFRLGAEARGQWQVGEQALIPTLGFTAVQDFSDDDLFVSARFDNAPGSGFTVVNSSDSTWGEAEAGLSMQFSQAFSGGLFYRATVGRENAEIQSLSANLSFRF